MGCLATVAVAAMSVSCLKDEIVSMAPSYQDGNKICFGVNTVWEEDQIDTRSGSDFGTRQGSMMLRSADSSDSLAVGVYVKEGIASPSSPATKGTPVTTVNLTDFGVWCTFTNTEVGPQPYFSNISVTNNTATSYYWPGSDFTTLSFLAVAPYSPTGLTADNTTMPASFTYTVPDTPANQQDVMVAKPTYTDNTANFPGNYNTAVSLDFQHILTQVQFAVGETPEGTIKSITLKPAAEGKTFVTGGTYTIAAENPWSNTSTGSVSYTVSETTTGAGVFMTDNVVGSKLFLMPQQISADQITLEVVFNDNTFGERVLSVSIPEINWEISNTYTYKFSISEAYDLKFVTAQADIPTRDCHYEIQEITISTGGKYTGAWSLTSDSEWATLVVKPTRDESNLHLYYQGYWAVEDKGSQTISGDSITGEIEVLVYLYENTNNSDADYRSATISFNAVNGDDVVPVESRTINQYEPIWNNGIAFERIEEYTSTQVFPWGFNWENTEVKFTGTQSYLRGVVFNLLKIFFGYGADVELEFDGTSATVKMPSIALSDNAISASGFTNTTQLLSFDEIQDLNTSIALLEGWGMQLDQTSISAQPTNFAARMILNKNKFNRKTEEQTSIAGTTTTTNIAVITTDGYEWFLPSKEEVSGLINTAADNDSSNNDTPLYTGAPGYWTSNAVSDSNTDSYYFTSTGTVAIASRSAPKRVRAARSLPTTNE